VAKNGQNKVVFVGGSALNGAKPTFAQATIGGMHNMNGTENESENETGFPHRAGMTRRPIMESADSLINTARPITHEYNCASYVTDDLQTLVSKRMSYLSKHAAAERVCYDTSGYVKIADLINWLYQGACYHGGHHAHSAAPSES